MSIVCEFCKKEFINKYTLSTHQNTTKKCIDIQHKLLNIKVEKIKIINDCKYCNKVFTSKQSLIVHLNICNDKKLQDKILEKEIEMLKKEKDREIEMLKMQNENYKEQIKDLQNKLDRIANKAIDKPTTFTTTNNTINNKFDLNTFPSQKEIDRKIESQFNDKYILDGMKGIAQFVYDHIVKLEDGSMAYACFDTSRQIFKYKDENGNEIKDPKAVRLRKMIKPGLLRQSQTLLDYFNDECNYLEKRKDNGHDIDGKEYNMMNTLREKAFEVGCDILSIEETSKFSNELANLSCV
jgi:hypothetical protein